MFEVDSELERSAAAVIRVGLSKLSILLSRHHDGGLGKKSNLFLARFLAGPAEPRPYGLVGARVAARQSAELPLHLWPTRIPGTSRPGPAGSASTIVSCYGESRS